MATSLRPYGPAQPGTSNATLYTAAAVTIVRNIHVVNTTASAATITIALGGTSDTAANHFLSALSIPENGSYDWSGFLHVPNGGTITGKQGTSAALTVTISGATV